MTLFFFWAENLPLPQWAGLQGGFVFLWETKMPEDDAKPGCLFLACFRCSLMASTGHSLAVFPDLLLFQDYILLELLSSLDLGYFCLPGNFHHQWDFLEVLCWKTKC